MLARCLGCITSIAVIFFLLSTVAFGEIWQDIAGELMSPACPGRTLTNCTSSHAEQWRELIRQKIAQGESKAEILQYFVDIGGEEILAAPPKRGFTLTVWLLPLFVIVNGAILIFALTSRWVRHTTPHATEGNTIDNPPTEDDHSLDPYVKRVQSELTNLQ